MGWKGVGKQYVYIATAYWNHRVRDDPWHNDCELGLRGSYISEAVFLWRYNESRDNRVKAARIEVSSRSRHCYAGASRLQSAGRADNQSQTKRIDVEAPGAVVKPRAHCFSTVFL